MRRRKFITLVAGAAAWPFVVRAQQPAMPTIGFLHAGSADGYARELAGFQQGLHEAGYVEGKNIAIDFRWADGHYDRLPALAADLVREHVAVIAAAPGNAALVAKEATQTVPIVFEGGADPVRLGLVASLNRPGGNITGIVNQSNTLVTKRIELMREVVQNATVITVLANPSSPSSQAFVSDAQKAQASLGIQIQVLEASTLSEIEKAFAKVATLRTGALVIGVDAVFTSNVRQTAELASCYLVPTSSQLREFASAGGLMSYGANLADAYRLTGVYVGRILRGEKPADLPVQQSAKIEFVINLKAAKALGLAVSLPLLGRADEVIE